MKRISFEDFMQAALHDPARGYYARHIRAVGGPRGDFTTVPMRGDILARAIARWAAAAIKQTGCRHLIEIGPGEGILIRDVLRHLPWITRIRVHPHLVETSPVLADRQLQTLGRRATWHATMADAIRACHGRAVIFSNELIDAFPVRVFQKSQTGWRELHLELDDHGNVRRECWQDDPVLPDSSTFGIQHPVGQRVEVHQAAHQWLAGWLPDWRAGEMLTIDYGSHASRLYHRRPAGTLRGYLMQHRVTGQEIYQNIGRQDLTADVNFTDLARWSAPWCQSDAPEPLAHFLRQTQAPPELLDLDGAGGAFLTLIQRPSMERGL
jgi:SAM-dependent MidA family methyltransferase